jgi:SAM-dependent methyltransferase
MPVFPLDAIRNAVPDRSLEPMLEDVREDLLAFEYPTGFPSSTEDVVEAFDAARPRLNVVVSLLSDASGAAGADISTGIGFLPVLLQRRGLRSEATEADPATAAYAAARGVSVHCYRIGRDPLPFEASSLDFVVLAEVLEHLKQPPIRVLRELGSLLCPGGRLVLTTPNVARLQHVETLAAGENFLEPFWEESPAGADPTDHLEHVREYSAREVVEAVEAAGLEVTRLLATGWGESGYNALPNPFANEIIVVQASR